jgi:serine dehydrogenase proteinase
MSIIDEKSDLQRQRLEIIKELQEIRGTEVICYITADRPTNANIPGMVSQVSQEHLRIIYDHLDHIGETNHLDLFIYTRGGDADVPWPMISYIREFCSKFSVLVPYHCHSAGTLICLGADDILMGKAATLSSVDPTTANQFNPRDPLNPGIPLGISVEDVTAYLSLARESAKITEQDHIIDVFNELAKQVHPLALGNVYRQYTRIRMLANNLLKFHMRGEKNEAKVGQIVEIMTEKLYTHTHFINRREAKKVIGLNVIEPNTQVEKLMWALKENYAADMHLHEPFDLNMFVGEEAYKEGVAKGVFVESLGITDAWGSVFAVSKMRALPPNLPVPLSPEHMQAVQGLPFKLDVKILKYGWERTLRDTKNM